MCIPQGFGIAFQKVVIDFDMGTMSGRRLGIELCARGQSALYEMRSVGFESWLGHFSYFSTK